MTIMTLKCVVVIKGVSICINTASSPYQGDVGRHIGFWGWPNYPIYLPWGWLNHPMALGGGLATTINNNILELFKILKSSNYLKNVHNYLK
jgi:hypothetical protein